jgi:hypothetical protein
MLIDNLSSGIDVFDTRPIPPDFSELPATAELDQSEIGSYGANHCHPSSDLCHPSSVYRFQSAGP